jgi:2-polyprenyl-3-methyl-5-hydroxy-6-metoxy-1,4-benzoquinol methylase
MLNLSSDHAVTVCNTCRFRFLSPRPTRDEYTALYASGTGPLADLYGQVETFYTEQSSLRLAEYRKKLQIFAAHGITGGRLLELGAWRGEFLNEAQQRGFDPLGIEPSQETAAEGAKTFNVDIRPGFIEDFSFEPNSFDVVFSSHVFEHLLDPLGVAKRVTEWLRPGGLHMIEVPNQFELFAVKRRRLSGRPLQRERTVRSVHHTVFYGPKTLRLLARESGCDPVHVRNVLYSRPDPRNPRALLRHLNYALMGAPAIELLARKPA